MVTISAFFIRVFEDMSLIQLNLSKDKTGLAFDQVNWVQPEVTWNEIRN